MAEAGLGAGGSGWGQGSGDWVNSFGFRRFAFFEAVFANEQICTEYEVLGTDDSTRDNVCIVA
jgi:hypothetical protein